jgi:hypothetical protein
MKPTADDKQALVDSIADILCIPRDVLGPGSKEHKAFIANVARALSLQVTRDDTKLTLARRLIEFFGGSWLHSHYSRGSSIQTNAFRFIFEGLVEKYGESHDVFMASVLKHLSTIDPAQPPPEGNSKPVRAPGVGADFRRCKKVAAWILFHAKGKCEYCSQAAPFSTDLNVHYLEVHHVRTLASGGPDTVGNTVALCPNCHRAAHLSRNRREITEKLKKRLRERGYGPN